MNLQIIDSHCHLSFLNYNQDRDEVIKRAQAAGVATIGIGVNLESSIAEIKLAEENENMWVAVGAHPTDTTEKLDIQEYEKLLSNSNVVAIGEIGLDYYRTLELEKREQQKIVFQKFLELAVKSDKPVVIHSRDAGQGSLGIVHADLLAILHNNMPARAGVAHSFTGSIDEARRYLDAGFYLGFNGIITFARQYDDLVKFAPMDRILLETDAPFLAPERYRVQKGARNEPAYIIEVAKMLAELKGESLENIISQTTKNTRKLFGL